MSRLVVFTFLLCLNACQQAERDDAAPARPPAATEPSAPQPPPLAAPSRMPVSVSYDWSFYAHGGSGDLFFGDGDWSNEEFILSFTCLPGSGQAGLSLQGEPGMPAQLISGDQRVDVRNGGTLPLDHPMLRAFAADGSIRVIAGAAERSLAAKPGSGRIAIESFFAYCAAG